MVEKHEAWEERGHSFDDACEKQEAIGRQELTTRVGTQFVARAAITTRGERKGERVIRYQQNGREYGRTYRCCWEHHYNCNRTRIGMYSRAVDAEAETKENGDTRNRCDLYSVLLRYWSVQNTILRACRSTFFVVSTFTLGFATDMMFSPHAYGGVLLSGPVVIPLALLWTRTSEDRGHNDSYFRMQILKLEAGQMPEVPVLAGFREWQRRPPETKYYRLSVDPIGSRLLESRTRRVLDFWLPRAYLAWWLVLAALSARELYLNCAGGGM